MHAIKCLCGYILNRQLDHCPECGESVEALLEKIKQDFYRVNFGSPEQ